MPDRLLVGVSLVGYSLPTFFIGRSYFSSSPSSGGSSRSLITRPSCDKARLGRGHPVLPALTLAAVYAASYVRLTGAYMLETLSEDYIGTARAKGVKERTVIRRHGLRAALTPIVTAAGLDLGGLLGGAIISEQVFNIQGLGRWIAAISTPTCPRAGFVLVAAFFIVIANLIVDVMYGVIDPRVRLA